jgi:hypothetical protein
MGAKPHPNEYSWPTVPLTVVMSARKLVAQGFFTPDISAASTSLA